MHDILFMNAMPVCPNQPVTYWDNTSSACLTTIQLCRFRVMVDVVIRYQKENKRVKSYWYSQQRYAIGLELTIQLYECQLT